MYLAHRKVRKAYIKCDLPRGEIVESERLEELVERLRAGESTSLDRDEITSGHINYVVSIACRYATTHPNKADDLVAECLFAIAKTLAHPERLNDNNITPYIIATCHSRCNHFLRRERMIAPRGTDTAKLRTAAGKDSGIANAVALDAVAEPFRREVTLTEIEDILQFIAKTDREKEIVRLRSMGYTNEEVSMEMHISESLVQQTRAKLEEKFLKLAM